MASQSIWFCSTNSWHQHSTEWEAENCSEMYKQLCIAARDLAHGNYDPDERWHDMLVRPFEERK